MIRYSPGISDKLVGIFILIKVLPLIVLAWFAWNEISTLAKSLENHVNEMAKTSQEITADVGKLASENSIRALDIRSREAIERLTTDTARQISSFLYERDQDINYAALLPPDEAFYKDFLLTRSKSVTRHAPWIINEDGSRWVPANPYPVHTKAVLSRNKDNDQDFHYRPPEFIGTRKNLPLYLEITYVGLDGMEKIKVTTSSILSDELRDISKKENTYCKAETYFEALKKLAPGEIYVSDVIGPYIKTHMIGPYTQKRAQEMGIEFKPEDSGYGGKENPVGIRFQGLIRWATPVVEKGVIKGYVTLALDHSHIMEFSDFIKPTEERYSDISDPGSGNYAFIWDHKGRNISHPRDYFITGYDPETGEPAIPWLDKEAYELWSNSDLTLSKFLIQLPEFYEQALSRKPSSELVKKGLVGLDCRYLNFAPQCDGWNNITQYGGSGSFVIFWSGLLKLTTAATIPYYTGPYKNDPRGFGFVTIGANVDEFHRSAVHTAKEIQDIETAFTATISLKNRQNKELMTQSLTNTASRLTFYTMLMIVIVILIAIFMASNLTGRITRMINGLTQFEKGDMTHRLNIETSDEMGQLATSFNRMADSIQNLFHDIQASKQTIENTNISLKEEIQERIQVEQKLKLHQDHLEDLVKQRTGELETTIYEQKRTEEALRKSEEKFVKLFMVSPVWMSLTRMSDGKFIDVNQAFTKITGHSREETLGSTVNSLGLWKDRQSRKDALDLLETRGQLNNYPIQYVMKNGNIYDFLWSSALVEIDNERCAISVFLDITQIRQHETEMAALRNILHNIVNSMPSVIIGVNKDKAVTLWNREAEKNTGIDAASASGKLIFDVFPFLLQNQLLISQAIEQGKIRIQEKNQTIINNEVHYFDVIIYPLLGKEIEGAVIRIDNVTHRVLMEERIIQSEKMQSIGSLAAGMAHEINNPLAGIMQNIQVIRNRFKTNLPLNIEAAEFSGINLEHLQTYMEKRQIYKMIDAIMTAGRRAAEIVENMLSFSRKSESKLELSNLSELLDKTVEIVQNDYNLKKKFDFRNIEIVREYDPNVPQVTCDRNKLQQVFFNILENGAHAMMDLSGTDKKLQFRFRHYVDKNRACIDIEDNGPGMDEKTKMRIFEPFFTTKPVGVGTGLGLYICYFIIAGDHKGMLSVQSTPGKGTTFTIRLPL